MKKKVNYSQFICSQTLHLTNTNLKKFKSLNLYNFTI